MFPRQWGSTLDMSPHEIIARLFATATSFAEAAHEATCSGQAHEASTIHYRSAVRRILSATHDLEELAGVINELIDQLEEADRSSL